MTSPELRWVEQWRRTAIALAEQKRSELSRLTEEKALAATEALLALAPLSEVSKARRTTSGLVEQQALFHRRPVK